MKNLLKARLNNDEILVGTWVTTNSQDVTELLATSGFDFLVFDMEHAPLTMESVQSLIQATNGSPATPLVRVAWNDPVLIKLALDIGSHGLLIPSVSNKEEASKAIQATRYPPKGIRGVGPRRASNYYRGFNEYMASAEGELISVVQIEHINAVRNADDIAAVEGVGALFVGPADLSASMNLLGEYSNPKVIDAIDRVIEVAQRHDLPIGIHAGNPDEANKRIQQGFKMVVMGTDVGYLAKGVSESLTQIKKGKP